MCLFFQEIISTAPKHAGSEYSSNVCVRRLLFAVVIGVIVAFPSSQQATSNSLSVAYFFTMALCCAAGCTDLYCEMLFPFFMQVGFLLECIPVTMCNTVCPTPLKTQFSKFVLMGGRRLAMLV
jgi:hypothetical protein